MDRKLFYIIKNVFALLIGRRNKRLGNFELCHIRQWSTAYLQMMCWLVPSITARGRRERGHDEWHASHGHDARNGNRGKNIAGSDARRKSGRDGGERDKGILPGPARFLSLSISLSFCRRTSPPRSGRVVRRSPASPGWRRRAPFGFLPPLWPHACRKRPRLGRAAGPETDMEVLRQKCKTLLCYLRLGWGLFFWQMLMDIYLVGWIN